MMAMFFYLVILVPSIGFPRFYFHLPLDFSTKIAARAVANGMEDVASHRHGCRPGALFDRCGVDDPANMSQIDSKVDARSPAGRCWYCFTRILTLTAISGDTTTSPLDV